eukprot:222009-Pyramimonas_sp.AAC.1
MCLPKLAVRSASPAASQWTFGSNRRRVSLSLSLSLKTAALFGQSGKSRPERVRVSPPPRGLGSGVVVVMGF